MLTVHGIATEMKMDNIANMTCANLADLYTAYVRKQAQCLLDVEGDVDSNNPSLSDLHRWGLEAQAVLICFSMCNPNNIGAVHSLNMKDGSLFQEPPPEHAPADLLVATGGGCTVQS